MKLIKVSSVMRTSTSTNVGLLLIRNCRWPDDSRSITRWLQFSAWNDVMAAILKLWRHIGNPTWSVDAYLLEKHSCQISPPSDLKRRTKGIIMETLASMKTRQLSCRTEDRTMRPIYGCSEKFWESSLCTRLLFQKFVMDFCSEQY